ncbi:MAG TPA: ROK family protein [Blastocatellia bacterium]|nr:ROK family protein [Blastocatellia bacterium]
MIAESAVAALDIGGTKISAGLISRAGDLLWQRAEATAQSSLADSLDQLTNLIVEAVIHAPAHCTVAGVGLAVPGWVNRRAGTVWAPNIAGWDHIPLLRELRQRVRWPLQVDSDRNAYVLGEAWRGRAAGLEDVVFLAVGTGIGAGIISGGRLIRGRDDLAGCAGWFALQPEFQELYAWMGCLEAEASGKSLGRKAEERDFFAGRDELRGQGARAVIEAAEHDDAAGRALLDEAAGFLGMGVANLISTLNPQMVVLGGGLFQRGEYLLAAVRRETMRWAQPMAAERVRIERSTLDEHAGLYGAARIAWDENSAGSASATGPE